MAEKTAGHAGIYDHQAERVLDETAAHAVVLLVLEGNEGTGFSVSGKGYSAVSLANSGELSWLLRELADKIEAGAPPDGVRATTFDD